jgi:hypothetical protein
MVKELDELLTKDVSASNELWLQWENNHKAHLFTLEQQFKRIETTYKEVRSTYTC